MALIAQKDMATVGASQIAGDWSIIKAVLTVPDATTKVKGISRLATSGTATSEIDKILSAPDPDSAPGEKKAVITPFDLQYYNFKLKMFKSVTSPLIPSGTKQRVVTTGLNNKDVTVQVYDTTGANLIGQVTRTLTTVTVDFNTPPPKDWFITVSGLDKTT